MQGSYAVRPLLYCDEGDADKNESTMITKMNTIHPNGLNLRCGNSAGMEETDSALALGNMCTALEKFDSVKEEFEATADAYADVSNMLGDDESKDVDEVCKKWLKKVHPDANSATFTASDVAAIVNDIREAAGMS